MSIAILVMKFFLKKLPEIKVKSTTLSHFELHHFIPLPYYTTGGFHAGTLFYIHLL